MPELQSSRIGRITGPRRPLMAREVLNSRTSSCKFYFADLPISTSGADFHVSLVCDRITETGCEVLTRPGVKFPAEGS